MYTCRDRDVLRTAGAVKEGIKLFRDTSELGTSVHSMFGRYVQAQYVS